MENPYRLPQALRAELGALAGEAEINRYPDPGADALKARLRAAMGIPAAAALVLGNGSDEIIQMLALAVAKPGATILAPEPPFVMFRMIPGVSGLDYVGVPLRADFSLDEAATLAAGRPPQPALTIFAYPNNPTGNLFDA